MTITSDMRVGKLAASNPAVTRVYHRYGIDFCCGGGKPLQTVCDEKGIDTQKLLAEIEQELATSDSTETNWEEQPLTDLISHILATYHVPLKEELPRLEQMARKVVAAHGPRDPERLAELLAVYVELKNELEVHMAKEEQILFPMIEQGHGAASSPIAVMEHEHEAAGTALRRLRELSDNYTLPEDACTTWRALWHGLETLESNMHQHIHLENNILFPRSLAQ
ncbi:MAG: iron-sulfur cluster repair di-iron protein [Gemmatimonadetes bacterium]|nr:iron-sulfur cluster repair di-iron protein [Gemmatimonadota bacterium]